MAANGKAEKNLYTHDFGDGKTVTVPKMKKLPAGVQRKIRKLDDEDRMWTLLELLLTPEELAVIDDIDMEELEQFNIAWLEASGIDVGELKAS